jgi:ABC-type sugar transport system ATPase subunit
MMEAPAGEPVLKLRGVTKRFGGVSALADVDFDLRAARSRWKCGASETQPYTT